MTSFIAAAGSGRSTSVIPAVPAASSVTTIAFIRHLPMSTSWEPFEIGHIICTRRRQRARDPRGHLGTLGETSPFSAGQAWCLPNFLPCSSSTQRRRPESNRCNGFAGIAGAWFLVLPSRIGCAELGCVLPDWRQFGTRFGHEPTGPARREDAKRTDAYGGGSVEVDHMQNEVRAAPGRGPRFARLLSTRARILVRELRHPLRRRTMVLLVARLAKR
jgi:hypothetical protein